MLTNGILDHATYSAWLDKPTPLIALPRVSRPPTPSSCIWRRNVGDPYHVKYSLVYETPEQKFPFFHGRRRSSGTTSSTPPEGGATLQSTITHSLGQGAGHCVFFTQQQRYTRTCAYVCTIGYPRTHAWWTCVPVITNRVRYH